MTVPAALRALALRWASATPSERGSFQSYLNELAAALEVEPPNVPGSDYEFEYPVRVLHRDGTDSINRVDLYKRGHFLLEAKDQGTDNPESVVLRKAFGQARAYAAAVEGEAPPYILVLDVGRSLLRVPQGPRGVAPGGGGTLVARQAGCGRLSTCALDLSL